MERLGRGQSHDFVTRLENVGLTLRHASVVVEADEGYARAMVEVVCDPRAWVNEIRTWFHARLFDKVEVPSLNVPLGERVERTLRMQVPFYLPSTRELTASELLNPRALPELRIDMRWADVETSGPAPFSVIDTGYWFWMELGGGHGSFEREQAARKEHRPYFELSRITAHAASLEEFLIGFLVGEALGRPIQFGNPARCLALRTQVQRVRDHEGTRETREEFLVSHGVLEKGQEWGPHRMTAARGFNWSTCTLGELSTAHNTNPPQWDYCWVDWIPATQTA